ncbi:hypothetical protein [Jongsikchunia kroppenstedtii]|uniref:hypothetical protein n=1 Tax=Jongsikchunia kroppenstedtii TaxID=1121721 RepID=UPI0003652348|nr:hypothetical protein [Jongsikchunia kroppenstedtii]
MTAATIVALCITATLPFALTPLVRIQHRAATLGAAGILVVALGVSGFLAHAAHSPGGAARLVAIVAAMLAAIAGGGIVVRAVLLVGGLSPWASDTTTETTDDDTTETSEPNDSETPAVSGPLRGGRLIGFLERASVAAALLAHWPAGLAIILAMKGLARYPELRAPHAAEQFIIGTFTSVLWAIAAAGTGYLLLT